MSLKVHLFIPCFIDQLFPRVGIATVHLLEMLGCQLVCPEEQTCCGQPAFNSGYWKETTELAERFLAIFDKADYVVAPSGSCVSLVKKMYGELSLSESARQSWLEIHPKVYEFSQFLEEVLHIEHWEGRFPAKVTYHDACHGLRELRISRYPRQLLKTIADLDFIEMDYPDTCCGFGGTFAIKFAEISTAMVKHKARWIQESGADIVTAIDSSCLMHIDGYLKRNKIPVQTMHLTEILWKATQQEDERSG